MAIPGYRWVRGLVPADVYEHASREKKGRTWDEHLAALLRPVPSISTVRVGRPESTIAHDLPTCALPPPPPAPPPPASTTARPQTPAPSATQTAAPGPGPTPVAGQPDFDPTDIAAVERRNAEAAAAGIFFEPWPFD